ncbi:haloacid dehalogenase, type II [Cyphellophora europaea CBS 101466]|uniref:Haloacid dehalogenase, type II n=1 Tax=Cyphellophora europaea (strain CBS 101466) TaxID=1220924 RepID=W2S338_CYPE1|nr:haloacid dehalogenase, type II [Cyphellophora europaea CBS 101466]ETN42359.1 haloacid dehalogenase, type II [Cyphellophora europaea CBS 101466]
MDQVLVAFDLYGTLLSTASVAKALAEHFGEDQANSIAQLWRRYQLEYTWRLNSMKKYEDFSEVTRKSLHHALAEHGVSLDDEQADELMKQYDNLSTFPDVEPALKKLAANPNVNCVIFSNGTKSMVTNSVRSSDDLKPLGDVFKDIVTVDFVRSFKPAPEVYKYLAQRTQKTGAESSMWLVSGNPFDVCGARAVGMQAAWVDRQGNGWQDKLGGEPTAIVKSLEEVEAAIEKFAQGKL